MTAYAVVEALDHVSGMVAMQTKPNGDYTLVFSSLFYYGDNSTATDDDYYAFAKTWITCHATAPEDGVRTCNSTGEVLTGKTTTKTGTRVEPTTEVWTTTTRTYATQTSLISNSVLITMSDHMRPASFERLLTRRTSSTDESTITAAPSTG
ncbi:hypothetical protein LTR84_002110 [Exophiala bonariae]|uniref:Lipocalin-like domain-containing protein n=1 Tax=Exophiala bonariae TaxID=1690606 RepID=A0AAV9NBM9_9EURO|nr:hypothetical protein LTR84_002110 [Exophiala bonariae]